MQVSESFINSWFSLQCQLIAGLQRAYVDLRGASVHPDGLTVTCPSNQCFSEELALAAALAKRTDSTITGTTSTAGAEPDTLRIACPLHLGSHAEGAVVIEVKATLAQQATILQLLRFGESWLNLALSQQNHETRAAAYKRIIDGAMKLPSYADALSFIVAAVRIQTGCTRLVLGCGSSKKMRLEAVSELVDPDKRSARVKMLEQTMREAAGLGETVCWSEELADPDILTSHCAMAQATGLGGICTVPVKLAAQNSLVFCFEFEAGFSDKASIQSLCQESATIIAPLISYQRHANSSWWARFCGLCNDGVVALAGIKDSRARLSSALALAMAFVVLMTNADYRVSASAILEGAVQRAVVAPFDGYVVEAMARAGQDIAEGDLLAQLDNRELTDQQRKLRAEEQEISEQYRQALATLDHGQAKIIEAQLQQASARLSLVNSQLARTQLRAPITGMVISGDWSRSLGVPVKRGELLFQLAPLDHYKVVINVPDKDIASISTGQSGKVTLSALPGHPVAIKVSNISSMAVDSVRAPAFRVEADLLDADPTLRPGMQGTAKVTVGKRRRWWIWTHSLTDWLRLQYWRWRP